MAVTAGRSVSWLGRMSRADGSIEGCGNAQRAAPYNARFSALAVPEVGVPDRQRHTQATYQPTAGGA